MTWRFLVHKSSPRYIGSSHDIRSQHFSGPKTLGIQYGFTLGQIGDKFGAL